MQTLGSRPNLTAMQRLGSLASSLSIVFASAAITTAQDPPEARPQLSAPTIACPVSPVLARVEAPGPVTHKLPLPKGEWLVRVSSDGGERMPFTFVVDGEEATDEAKLLRGMPGVHWLSLAQPAVVEARLDAKPEHVDSLYSLSVHPIRPRPSWTTVLQQELELDPQFVIPTLQGPRCAAPVIAMLEAGMRYRIDVDSDDVGVSLLAPAQNGLGQLDAVDSVERFLDKQFGKPRSAGRSPLQFVAPRSGVYLFWCFAERANYRTRPRVVVQQSDPLAEGIFPADLGARLELVESRAGTVVAWRRPDLWLNANDPPLFVPFPSRQLAAFTLRSNGSAASMRLRAGEGMTHPFSIEPGATHQFTVTMLEGEPGVWLEAEKCDGPIDLEVRLQQPLSKGTVGQLRGGAVQLPIVLRGEARAGSLVSVRACGAGCAPQITMRGAGIEGQCLDPTGFSLTAALEGLATRDGEVEVVIAAAAAEPHAVAYVATGGFGATPAGDSLRLDLGTLQWLSTPGRDVLHENGEWADDDDRLPGGAKVDWRGVTMRAGNVYRILATASQTPDLVLDVPGVGRSTSSGGIAMVVARADGDATIGVAAAGADVRGAYALQVRDLGPAAEQEATR